MIIAVTLLDRGGRLLLLYEGTEKVYEFLHFEIPDELPEEQKVRVITQSLNQFLGTTVDADDMVKYPGEIHPDGWPLYGVLMELNEGPLPSRWPPGHTGIAYIHAMQTRWPFVAKTILPSTLSTITALNQRVLDSPQITEAEMDRAFTGTFLTVMGEYPEDFKNSKQVQIL